MNQEDLYYILQEVDYHVGTINSLGGLFRWEDAATNTLLGESPPPTAIQTSPQTTLSTTSVTSGVQWRTSAEPPAGTRCRVSTRRSPEA